MNTLWTLYLGIASLWVIMAWVLWLSFVGSDSGQAMPGSFMGFAAWVFLGALALTITAALLAVFS